MLSECDSTTWPPLLRQLMSAVHVAFRVAVAFVLPTPASVNPLQVRVVPLAEHPGVPVFRWVPVGAFAGLVVVPARAGPAKSTTDNAPVNISDMALRIRPFLLRFRCRPK